MTTKVISYSFTGNNDRIAEAFAKEIGAEHFRITEPKKRTAGMIVKENLFNKDPKITLSKDVLTEDDFVVFFGPFWFGKMASPLRAYFKQLKGISFDYGFASLCVGFDNSEGEEKFKGELIALLGSNPKFLILKKIVDLLPPDPAPTQNMITQYRLSQDHTDLLVSSIKAESKDFLP